MSTYEKVSMVLVGPLTNLALALQINSKLVVDKIDKVYIMVLIL